MTTAKELAAFILKNYQPDELLIWQTFSKDDIDEDMSDELWADLVERMDDVEVSASDFGITETLSELFDEYQADDDEYQADDDEDDEDK
jgi:hypothetical protein